MEKFYQSIKNNKEIINKKLFLDFLQRIPENSTFLEIGEENTFYYDDSKIKTLLLKKNISGKCLYHTFNKKNCQDYQERLKSNGLDKIFVDNTSFYLEKEPYDYFLCIQIDPHFGAFAFRTLVEKRQKNFNHLMIYRHFYRKDQEWISKLHFLSKYILRLNFDNYLSKSSINKICQHVDYKVEYITTADLTKQYFFQNIPYVNKMEFDFFCVMVKVEQD